MSGLGFNYPGTSRENNNAPNNYDANRWVKATIPVTGTVFHASGASPRNVGPLDNDTLYVIVCYERAHFLASTGSNISASRSDLAWEGGAPIYHIARSGSSQFISGYGDDGGAIEYWVAKVEF